MAHIWDDFHRVLELERRASRAQADEVVPLPFGEALLTPSLPFVHFLNTVVVDRPADGVSPADVLATTERLLAGIGVSHRRIRFDEEVAAAAIFPLVRGPGWRKERHDAMTLRADPDRGVDTGAVQELDVEAFTPLHAAFLSEEPWAGPHVVDEMVVALRRLAAACSVRCFAVVQDGNPAAGAMLIASDGVAEVDAVHTAQSFRGRGFGRMLTQACVDAARQDRAEVVCLFADEDDWPKELYARMGFRLSGAISYATWMPPQTGDARQA